MDDSLKPAQQQLLHKLIIAIVLAVLIALLFSYLNNTSTPNHRKVTKLDGVSIVASKSAENIPTDAIRVCEGPIFTVALTVDRSGSIVNRAADTPEIYKNNVKRFIQKLYDEIVVSKKGKLNVLLYAFASRSVMQNESGSNGQRITLVSDDNSLNSMKNAVDRIYFANNAYSNDASSMAKSTSDPYDIARSYNAGAVTTEEVPMFFTNWDDAFLDIDNVATNSYSSTEPGKHIDLALMITDGQPNANNDSDRVFQTADITNSDQSNRTYLINDVNNLRKGNNGKYPPIDVRGILINPSEDADSAMNLVFGNKGPRNWEKADDFDNALQEKLDMIVDDINANEECHWEYIQPKIRLDAVDFNPTLPVTLQEGNQNGRTVTVRICNLTEKVPLHSPEIVAVGTNVAMDPGFKIDDNLAWKRISNEPGGGQLAPKDQPGSCINYRYTFNAIALGGDDPGRMIFFVRAQFNPTRKYRLDPAYKPDADGSFSPITNMPLALAVSRVDLPA